MDNSSPKVGHLKIASWNAYSIKAKKLELLKFLQEHEIDVLLVQETFLKPQDKFTLQNYTIIRQDRLRERGGGTLVATRKNIYHYEIPNPHEELEGTFIAIPTREGTVVLGSLYISPTQGTPFEQEHLEALFEDPSLMVIIGGDLNAKHQDWGCRSTSNRGALIQESATELEYFIRPPNEPTHYGSFGQPEILDLFLLKNIRKASTTQAIHDLSSDHLPIIFEYGDIRYRRQYTKVRTFTDWGKLQEKLEAADDLPTINSAADLEALSPRSQTTLSSQ